MIENVNSEMPVVRRSFYTVLIKRFLDIILSVMAIGLLAPLLLLLCVLELLIHGKPIFFVQERTGLHGKRFRMYKFRSMTDETDENGELLPGEQRVTPFGRFLRRFSLDELPELFCIFGGQMSFIGPRPLLPEYLPYYTKRHMMRHEMRPGLACAPLKPMETWTWNDQFENDIWYIENCSFFIDLKMIFIIAKEALTGSKYRVDDTREEFNGKNLYSDAKGVMLHENLSDSAAS